MKYNKKLILGIGIMIVATIIIGCQNFSKSFESKEVDSTVDKKEAVNHDSSQEGDNISKENGRGLNDIRFANFTDKDWYDNEYIRCLRKYLDDYNSGKVKDGGLDPYKEKIRGKFVIGSVEPFLMGGLFIRIVFVDCPKDVFSSWVYSSVDEDSETIIDYEVHGIRHEGESEFTKEDIQQFLKENPNQKMW